MCRSLFAAAFMAAAYTATAPAVAYTLSVDGHSPMTYEQFRDLEPHEGRYFIWILPEGDREPEESVVMICSHAHDLPYHEGRRPSENVERCAWDQIGLTANEGLFDGPLFWLYPDRQYQFAFTWSELENIYAHHVDADDVPENEWPAWYKAELTELEEGLEEDREVDAAQNERLDDHESRIVAAEEAIDDGVTMIEETFAFLDNEWRALALVTLVAIIALLLLLFWPRKRNEAAPIAASAPPPAPPRTATIPVRSEAVRFSGTIEVPLPPDMEVEQEPAEEAPRPDVPPAAEASPEPAPALPPQTPAPPAAPASPPSSDVEEVWVEDKEGNRHMVPFTRVPGQNGVATRYVNPLTGNLVGQDHLRKHAKEYLKQKQNVKF